MDDRQSEGKTSILQIPFQHPPRAPAGTVQHLKNARQPENAINLQSCPSINSSFETARQKVVSGGSSDEADTR